MKKKYYIKERHNPQIGVCYVAEGQLSARDAKRMESSLHGYNVMRGFDAAEAYEEHLEYLRSTGERVH